MLNVTRAVDYAIRAMVCIANHPHEVVDVKFISRQEDISEVFLAKLLQKMRKADLVVSKRGVSGGFSLSKSAVYISLFDVVDAVGGFDGTAGRLTLCSDLVDQKVVKGLSSVINNHLKEISIASLV